jgi:hypothetical protein
MRLANAIILFRDLKELVHDAWHSSTQILVIKYALWGHNGIHSSIRIMFHMASKKHLEIRH